jgi:hypothetical protein
MPYVTSLSSGTKKPVVVVAEGSKPKGKPKNTVVYEIPKPTLKDDLRMKGRLTAVERRKLGRLDANDRIAELVEGKPKKTDIRKWFEMRMAELND